MKPIPGDPDSKLRTDSSADAEGAEASTAAPEGRANTNRAGGKAAHLDAQFSTLFQQSFERTEDLCALRDWVDIAEAWYITRALQLCRGNRSAAARALGIGRRTLYAKMEKLGIQPTWSATSVPGLQASASGESAAEEPPVLRLATSSQT